MSQNPSLTPGVPHPQVLSSILGFSRMGPNRELKRLVEGFWKECAEAHSTPAGAVANFEKSVDQLQTERWTALRDTGIDLIPSGDYSLYDHVLDTAFLFQAIPERYKRLEKTETPTLRTYFAMARGLQEKGGVDVPALPMKKWFDTNYHFIVPELQADQKFHLASDEKHNKPLRDFKLAKSTCQLTTKPVLLGPITFLHLSHVMGEPQHAVEHLKLLPALVPEYVKLVEALVGAGAEWIQVDEPVFGLHLPEADAHTYHHEFKKMAAKLQSAAGKKAHIIFTTYFNAVTSSGNMQIVQDLPPHSAIHVDLVRSPQQLELVLQALPPQTHLSLGLVDGRNVWLTPLLHAVATANKAIRALNPEKAGDRIVLVATSCSLLHVPYSLAGEAATKGAQISAEKSGSGKQDSIFSWLAFGMEKCHDVVLITKAINGVDRAVVDAAVSVNSKLLEEHSVSELIHNREVKKRLADVKAAGVQSLFRQVAYGERVKEQRERLQLPLIPTSTIGSFPQSADVRAHRAKFKSGRISQADYNKFIDEEVARCIRIQEQVGLDILVHGEFERNDMVEFFADYLKGFLFTSNGWVQSYGSRCVKPPILYGDVYRPAPMTVNMIKYAQSLTKKPVKGMLTGPTTVMKWSFVRNDQSYKETLMQLALALRDEVADLDKADIKVIQVDEPAFREGLPLDPGAQDEYLRAAVEAFKVSTGSVRTSTQIQSHMCYSDFEDIFTHIAELDADVLCIECSRSELSLLESFDRFGYPLGVGPGLYDIHSPRVPTHAELKFRLLEMVKYIPASRLYANPDCGLKTRDWPEVKAALGVMVDVVQEVREELTI